MIKQFSIDVEGDYQEIEIRYLLESNGVEVVGISWRGTWDDEDDYWEGEEPSTYD